MQVLDIPAPAARKCPKCKLDMKDVWICGGCNAKRSTLSKMFKGWPIEPFTELSDELQVDFWRQDGRTKQKLMQDLTIGITSYRKELEIRRKSGKFLPLSVFQAQGYKTDKIEKNCEKLWDEPLEEHTYRLEVTEVIEEKVRQDVVELLHNLRDSSIRGALSHYCSPGKKRGKKRTRSSSSSSRKSTSSGSSSASTGKSESNEDQAKAKKAALMAAKAKKQEAAAAAKAAAAKAKADEAQQKAETRAQAKAMAAEARKLDARNKALALKESKAQKGAEKKDRLLACISPLLERTVTTASATVSTERLQPFRSSFM